MSFVSNLFMKGMLSFGGFIKPVCYLYIAFLWFFGSDRILSSEVVYFSNETFYAVLVNLFGCLVSCKESFLSH